MRTPPIEDDGVGGQHPEVERRPPEVERLDDLASQHQEGRHEPHVRRVEDVGPSIADPVLGEQGQGGDPGEQVPAVQRPVFSALLTNDAKNQGDTAAGEHGACRPNDLLGLTKGERHLDDGAGEDGGEDLGIETRKSRATCPSTWMVMMTPARCRRGSRRLGSTTG